VLGAPPNMCHLRLFLGGLVVGEGLVCSFLLGSAVRVVVLQWVLVVIATATDRGVLLAPAHCRVRCKRLLQFSSADSSTSLACTCSPAFTSTFPTPFLPPSPNTGSPACSTVSGVVFSFLGYPMASVTSNLRSAPPLSSFLSRHADRPCQAHYVLATPLPSARAPLPSTVSHPRPGSA
jgi:hypothetical protein